jgi:poly(3-hydroxybutyrate) depolymerase
LRKAGFDHGLRQGKRRPRIFDTMKHFAAALILPVLCSGSAIAGETVIKDSQGMDCFVYTPDPLVAETVYQLVVGVHGAGGKGNGAAGLKDWAKRGDVIVIGPSFVSKGERPYQSGEGDHADKLIDLFNDLKKDHKLRDKMFLHGFSGGAQFVHRFAMRHPELVCGVSAHSGGTWSTDNHGQISNSARKIPFAISCGEKDTAKSFPGSPFTRIEWFGRFRDEIERKRFPHIAAAWPEVGHSISPGAMDLAKQCFQLATGLPGESATQEVPISGAWKNIAEMVKSPPAAPAPRTPAVNQAELEGVSRAAFAKADAGEIPDDKLIVFMRKYPPVLWKDKPGSAKLLAQCERAAIRWHRATTASGSWHRAAKADFTHFTQGLAIATDR